MRALVLVVGVAALVFTVALIVRSLVRWVRYGAPR